jgi:hypothetical protein
MSKELEWFSIKWFVSVGHAELYIAVDPNGEYRGQTFVYTKRPRLTKENGFITKSGTLFSPSELSWLPEDYPLQEGKCVKINLVEQLKRQK